MNRIEAENFVYKSYLKAEKHQKYDAKDSVKRKPELSGNIIRKKAGTPCVLVTGSKGKGSVASMIAQILQTKYKTGLMTSPHIIDFCERFKVNNINISDHDFAKYMTVIQPDIEAIDAELPSNVFLSPMGIQAMLGLEYFNAEKTDFNVFECGKGAKFDDVNNILHQYAVINSIFLEHTRELGDTLAAIAEDKSHVITGEQKCVFIAEQSACVIEVLKKRAALYNVPLKIYGLDFKAENIRYSGKNMIFDVDIEGVVYRDMSVPLMGGHQAKNCALAMAFCKKVLGEFDLEAVKRKLSELNCHGRMEVISENPFMMLDACINSASCANVKDVLKHLKMEHVTVIIGIPDDKDYAGVVREMTDVSNNIILTKSQNPHYVFTDEQCKKMASEGIKTVWTNSVEEAIDKAKKIANPIVILGTTSVVAEVSRARVQADLNLSSRGQILL